MSLELTGRAFEHGANAYGAKYLKPGLTISSEADIAVALGWPTVRTLDPPSGWQGSELTDKILNPTDGTGYPSDMAARRVRALVVLKVLGVGQVSPETEKAMQDDRPFTEKTAAKLIVDLFKSGSMRGSQRDILFLLEALVGPDAVLLAIADAFDAADVKTLNASSHERAQWGTCAGFILLRASQKVGTEVRRRFDAVIARGMKKIKGDDLLAGSCVTEALDHAVNGHKSSPASREHELDHLILWSEATPAELVAALKKVEVDSWSLVAEPRLVLIGGDEVFDYYVKRWTLIKEAARQRQLVERFGLFTSPRVLPLMKELAAKSKAAKAATAWVAARGSGKATHPSPSAKSSTPAPKLAKLPALDPKKILAQLDAAMRGNDWPDFFALNPEDEFHGLRVLGFREGADWGVVFERLTGDEPDALEVRRWRFGSKADAGVDPDPEPVSFSAKGGSVTGPQGSLRVTKTMLDIATAKAVSRQGSPAFATKLHSYHLHFSGGLWPAVTRAAERVGLSEHAQVIVECDAFAHSVAPVAPSQSGTMKTLAAAVAKGDGRLFESGKPNTRLRDQRQA